MKTDALTYELLRQIVGNFGLVSRQVRNPLFSDFEFNYPKSINIEFDDSGIKKCQVKAAQANIQNNTFTVMFTDIGDSEPEYVLVYHLSDCPVFGLRVDFAKENESVFVKRTGDTWSEVGLHHKLMACAGIEELSSHGLTWLPLSDGGEKLYESLLQVAEM